ncbi:Hsp20 family protein [Rickettsiales bacterium]|nr:Hsp20 family protein [Rickettsiales bacterium]
MQNNITTLDRNRLMPFTVGFDQLFDKLYGLENNSFGFPPYNISKNDEYNYTIEMALAGYNKKDINVELKEGELSITSTKDDETIDSSIIHKGISNKNFLRKFTLSDEVHVKNAEMKDGMLFIRLERIIPEHRKPKTINIK